MLQERGKHFELHRNETIVLFEDRKKPTNFNTNRGTNEQIVHSLLRHILFSKDKKQYTVNQAFTSCFILAILDGIRSSKPLLLLLSAYNPYPDTDVGEPPGADTMKADDRQVTTVFTVQPSFHRRRSTNRVS